jgi:hypothetical protein
MSPEIETFFRALLGSSEASSGESESSRTVSPSAVVSAANAAEPAVSFPPPSAPGVEKHPSPNNGSDKRSADITALMSSTKLAEPEKKRGWFRGHRP